MKEICMHIRSFINRKGELSSICHKHYCMCKDQFHWDSELNERYQDAKKEGTAESGIFKNK